MTDTLHPARPIHPGVILRREMETREWTENMLSIKSDIPVWRIKKLLEGSVVTELVAVRLARAFSTSAEFWLNLQRIYDEAVAAKEKNT